MKEFCEEHEMYKKSCDRWRAQGMLDGACRTQDSQGEKRELLCGSCNREYPVWYAPNELWNKLVGGTPSFLCPTCFMLLDRDRIWKVDISK